MHQAILERANAIEQKRNVNLYVRENDLDPVGNADGPKQSTYVEWD